MVFLTHLRFKNAEICTNRLKLCLLRSNRFDRLHLGAPDGQFFASGVIYTIKNTRYDQVGGEAINNSV